MLRRMAAVILILAIAGWAGCGGEEEKEEKVIKPVAERLESYAPITIEVPWEVLEKKDMEVLKELYLASRQMDTIFLEQVYRGNFEVLQDLREKGDQELLKFFKINFGPWDRLASDRPFIGTQPKPEGANYYPPDMTREEFKSWIREHPEDKESFQSHYTVIRRTEQGGLKAVPYSEAYREPLEKAARHLKKAAWLTGNESLAEFLASRAKAFKTNRYFESNMAWMDVRNNLIDITIGPYEVYEDKLFGYKAAFESFLCIRDPQESKKLEGLKGYLTELERNLPIDDRYKNFERGTSSPIVVADLVFSAGDTRAGVQTLAFNLPNDERVREAKGCKKVMLRNICHAKFDGILMPIARILVDKEQLPLVTFNAYFNHILLHEFTHGLGPGRVTLPDGSRITVDRALKEANSAIEETKADVGGEYNIYYIIEDGFFPPSLKNEVAVTFLAGFFRSVRFGVEEAHGRANMIIFNYFKEQDVYSYDSRTGRWSVDIEKVPEVCEELLHQILMIQARGDYQGAREFIRKYGEMGEEVESSISRLKDLPVDIVPRFEIEDRFDQGESERGRI